MDKDTIIGMILFFALFVGYSAYTSWKYPREPVSAESSEPVAEATSPAAEATPSAPSAVAPTTEPATAPAAAEVTTAPASASIADADLSIETDTTAYRFSMESGSLAAIAMKDFRDQIRVADSRVNLIGAAPFWVSGSIGVNKPAYTGSFQGERQGRTLRFWRQEGPWVITQEYVIPEKGYGLKLNVTFRNASDAPVELTAVTDFRDTISTDFPSSGFLPGARPDRTNLISFVAEKATRTDAVDYCGKAEGPAQEIKDTEVTYFSFDRHYFTKAFLPGLRKIDLLMTKTGAPEFGLCQVSVKASQPFGQVKPGETVVMPFAAFMGPKKMDVLAATNESLKSSIDLGWFTVIAHPLLSSMKFFHGFVGNYGIAIIILTILLKILFYPLVKSSTVSMKRMQKLQPEMNRIKERFAEDKARQQQELMKFMSENKINPAKGCLPILPQIPVFVALYNVLANSIELRHAPFYGYIRDLSASDPYYITPVLLGVGMFVQQKLTPTTGMDKTQERMMMMMPVLFSVMMLSLPSGLVLYMLTNTIISIAQQQWLNKRVSV